MRPEKLLLLNNTIFLTIFLATDVFAQTINRVNNGGFEDTLPHFAVHNVAAAKYWGPIDTNGYAYHLWSKTSQKPSFRPPLLPYGYQQPRSGNAFILSNFYCDFSTCSEAWSRANIRNRLKSTLNSGAVYCVKYHIVNTNNCNVATSAYQAYFGDGSLDTIKYCVMPLTYLTPQISYSGPIISDTLIWIPITGTFVAEGSEKYMVLGNFLTNEATPTLQINNIPTHGQGTDLYIDDVSVIEMDAPAYAGPDQFVIPGDSVYIGSPRDFAVDEACMWYKLPNDSVPIDTVAGMWLKPTETATYVVRQQLWCSGVKWDTVTVHINPLGIAGFLAEGIMQFPNPAREFLEVKLPKPDWYVGYNRLRIVNSVGQVSDDRLFNAENESERIDVSLFPEGVYFVEISGEKERKLVRRFVVR